MKLKTREITIFAMLGALMCARRSLWKLFECTFIRCVCSLYVVYRKKRFILFMFVFLTGALNGFATWWIPYLYLWTVLWGMTMLLPKSMPTKVQPIAYMVVCSLHGFGQNFICPISGTFMDLALKGWWHGLLQDTMGLHPWCEHFSVDFLFFQL